MNDQSLISDARQFDAPTTLDVIAPVPVVSTGAWTRPEERTPVVLEAPFHDEIEYYAFDNDHFPPVD